MTAIASSSFDDTLSQMGIRRSGAAAGGPEVKTALEANSLGQDAFLKLLTEQLRNQDPFEPVKNENMVAQMAQFSSVAGISEMNKTLSAMATRMDSANAAQAIGYVGKTVLVEGDTAYPRTDGGLDAVVPLVEGADDVTVTISDKNGSLLRTMQFGAQRKGDLDLAWDGKTQSGDDAGTGPFKITATVVRNGQRIAQPVQVWAPVTSVSLGESGPMLNLAGLGQKPLTAVRQVG
jgi:flagellar basal-body rod modification protein FlgD